MLTLNTGYEKSLVEEEVKGDFESLVLTLDTGYKKSWVEEEVTSNEWGYREK